jgi:GDPmannose 4,6-dehydratase
VEVDPRYYRPTEVELLIGNPEKAERVLGWKAKTTFQDLVRVMVTADFEKVKRRGY